MTTHQGTVLEALEWEGVRYELKPDDNREAMRLEAWPVGATEPGWSETLPHPWFYRDQTALRVIHGQIQVWLEGRHTRGDHVEEYHWCFGPDGKPRKPFKPDPWAALQAQERRFITEALKEVAQRRWEQDSDDSPMGGTRRGPLTLELHAVRRSDWVTLVRFSFDYYLDFFAQSGSDWADHLLYFGTAEFHGSRLRRSSVEQVHRVDAILDRDVDDYERTHAAELRRAVRERELAKLTSL